MTTMAKYTRLLIVASIAAGLPVVAATESADLTLEISDYATMPVTGLVDGKGGNDGMLARINGLREEPGGANRFFVHDLNGPVYILDKRTKKPTVYLDFNGSKGHTGFFPKFTYLAGYGSGLIGFQFDPDYRRNGRFYTIHIEDPTLPGSNMPDGTSAPGLRLDGYSTTAAIATPGEILREGVLVEWTDSKTSDTTFEGTAREILRVQLNSRIHPLGELSFNPAAKPGDPEWRVLYLGSGDGGSGEGRGVMRLNPQRLDTLVGKILRIVPDLSDHQATSVVSENGRYRIPNDNPFVETPGARKEIWAYGFRNPHRLHWVIDSAVPGGAQLVANSVGLHTWETVNIVHKGANYGYSQREGNEALKPDNTTMARPEVDRIPVQVSDTVTRGQVAPTYAVIQYGHVPSGGDAIGAGFLYRGARIPALRGKYIFTDISTGRVWYADYREMLAADDGDPTTQATMHSVQIAWNDPADSPDAGQRSYETMFPIVEAAYHVRGGKAAHLPGRALVSGEGRADAQLATDAAGELYVLTKTDGVIRSIVGGRVP